MHLSDIFWLILGIFGIKVLIFDEVLRFSQKLSTLNDAFYDQKGKIGDLPDFYSFRLVSLISCCRYLWVLQCCLIYFLFIQVVYKAHQYQGNFPLKFH